MPNEAATSGIQNIDVSTGNDMEPINHSRGFSVFNHCGAERHVESFASQ